ncbi:NAD-dependent epimerase/dehydratase family protein [Niabella sp. CC-SYL272]|uniref:NAD-dependent epimerase/dehydratase family protein n=1 Tax=Niabella agricola TaxID=2891571 RepID=UPI001F273BC8|nr:NAD-dependent epimerase/dehydratase family protein [Niabella agricola]MCF3108757.1 NAD-dependent epimerase/dehydratase family protein [Niabella agricola]
MNELQLIEDELYQPSKALLEDLQALDGDIIFLGAGGKMGPSMIKLASIALRAANLSKRLIAVSRFSDEAAKKELEDLGVEIIAADLLDDAQLQALPDVKNVMYLAGTKFGTNGNEPFTWAMNAYLPGRVAEKYKNSRIVAFSTGNVYPFSKLEQGGFSEETKPDPVGEYGQSCLGRERIFQYFSRVYQTPVLIYRLNYAVDLRYGVLLEVGKSVYNGTPINISTGAVNVIWQGDANEIALRSFLHCSTPAKILNVTGPETISLTWLATQFGGLFDKQPVFTGQVQDTALLSNASEAHQLFGYPRVSLRKMIRLVADWIRLEGRQINKPTHFQERQGQF